MAAGAHSAAMIGGFSNAVSASAVRGVVVGGGFNTNAGRSAVILGGEFNAIGVNSTGAAIVGGFDNIIHSDSRSAKIGGGENNTASGFATTVGGGALNTASIQVATVSGGFDNTAAESATVGGGQGNTASGFATTVGGGHNSTANGSHATIGGGLFNRASNNNATVSGGSINIAGGVGATVGGGMSNTNDGAGGFIGGGTENSIPIKSTASVVAGGFRNAVSAFDDPISGARASATIGGGASNTASGIAATVPGGSGNVATNFAFAAGTRAKATNGGAFVWADGQTNDFGSLGTNTFNVRASGGAFIRGDANSGRLTIFPDQSDSASQIFLSENVSRSIGMILRYDGATNNNPLHILGVSGGVAGSPILTVSRNDGGRVGINQPSPTNVFVVVNAHCNGNTWVNSSDRALKTAFQPVDRASVLRKVAALPITEWTYKDSADGVRHIGPTAQDFRAAFGLGENDKTISTIDPSGVALAAIQGLLEELKQRDRKIDLLESEIGVIRERLANMPLNR